MAIVRIDTEDLQSKAQAVEGTIGRLQTEVNTMEAQLRQLQDTWQGQAAQNFQGLLSQWRGVQAQVEDSLSSIRQAMDRAAQQYSDVEMANATMFRG